MQRTELPLDVFTYNLAIDVCKEKCLQHHNTKACAEAYQLYDDMLERRVRPNSYTFILLVTACRCKPSTHWRQVRSRIKCWRFASYMAFFSSHWPIVRSL